MLKLNPELYIDVIGPRRSTLRTQPEDILPELFKEDRVKWIEIDIIANALVTRYEFNFSQVGVALKLADPQHKYDAVYINDPMLLRHYKALFLLVGKYRPRFYVHSHFVDIPSCPKFPIEASLWHGQCEAAIRADWNFWQCESAMREFENEARGWYVEGLVDKIVEKSEPWDDGYSREEITSPVDENKLRFTMEELVEKLRNKVVLFVPNRIGGKGRSSDYTNCGKFMFEVLPELRKHCKDFAVVCGNPSQKILNGELEQWCGKDGYVSLVPDALNRDEFKVVARYSHIAVGLYDQDAYGGTAARECIELGCLPLWLDCNEYSSIAREAGCADPCLAKADFSDLVDVAARLVALVRNRPRSTFDPVKDSLKSVVRKRCSYEATTPSAMRRMGLL